MESKNIVIDQDYLDQPRVKAALTVTSQLRPDLRPVQAGKITSTTVESAPQPAELAPLPSPMKSATVSRAQRISAYANDLIERGLHRLDKMWASLQDAQKRLAEAKAKVDGHLRWIEEYKVRVETERLKMKEVDEIRQRTIKQRDEVLARYNHAIASMEDEIYSISAVIYETTEKQMAVENLPEIQLYSALGARLAEQVTAAIRKYRREAWNIGEKIVKQAYRMRSVDGVPDEEGCRLADSLDGWLNPGYFEKIREFNAALHALEENRIQDRELAEREPSYRQSEAVDVSSDE